MKIIENSDGYRVAEPKPSESELVKYYEDKYYQEAKGSMELVYTQDELANINGKLAVRYHILDQLLKKKNCSDVIKKSILDLGCGEGFALNFFKEKGWDIQGMDFSSAGLRAHHPSLLGKVSFGDIQKLLVDSSDKNIRFDVIWLSNVLEHVIDPELLLNNAKKLLNKNGILVVVVPNDYSQLQLSLLDSGIVESEYWVALPDHISYFSRTGLANLCKKCGFGMLKTIGDFPVEWFLLNSNSNYVRDSSKGKSAHLARISIENMINSMNTNTASQFWEKLSELEMGRNIISYFEHCQTV